MATTAKHKVTTDLQDDEPGSIQTSWYVKPDDALGAIFLLTASAADGSLVTADDAVATATLTDAGSVITATGVTVTNDETAGLQNSTSTPTPAEDANDNEISVSSLPSAFSARLAELGAGTAIGAALSGYTGAAGNTGSDAFTIAPAPGGTITDVLFTGSNGAPLNGLDSGLDTLNGTDILLYTDTNNNIVLGRAGSASGAVVFAAYIEETGASVTGGKIWTVQYEALKHPGAGDPDDAVSLLNKVYIGIREDVTFSLANAPSGQNLFLMFTSANPATQDVAGVIRVTDPAIIATGKDPANQSTGANITTGDTINTSQAGGPTTFGTNNQMIVEGEGIRFSFVTGAGQDVTIPNLDQGEADVEANIDFTDVFNARSTTFDVVQLQSGKSAVVRISAFSTGFEPGTQFIDGYANDTPVAITNVRVFDAAGQVIENSNGTVNDAGIVITFASGVATISGVLAGYRIEYTTSADHNRVLVENAGTGFGQDSADFDIGGLKLLQVSTATAEIGSKILFEDDGPAAAGPAVTGIVDEDGLPNGIAGGTGDVAGAATTVSGSVAGIFQSGADTPLTYSLSSVTSGLPALTSGGVALTYSVAGNTLTAKAGATNVFTFALTNTVTGAYTFTLLKALDHPAGNAENDMAIALGTLLRATDKDGDTVTAAGNKLVIYVDDDTPTATGTAVTGIVDEDGLPNGIAGGTGDVAGTATTVSGSVAGIFQSGADTPLTYSLSSVTSGLPALTSGGVALTYSVAGNTLTAKAGTTNVFTFALTNTVTGAYTFTLLKALDHPAGNAENDMAISLGTLLRATDKDGDTVTAAGNKLVIYVDDDTPTATGTAVTGIVDEDGLPNGIAGGTGDVAGTATTVSGSVAGIFQSGADTPLTYSLSSVTSGLPALTSGGVALTYSVAGTTLTAKAGTTNVFTFALTNTVTGAYTFTLLKALDHPAGNAENDMAISLGTLLRATDKDGDTVTAAGNKLVIFVDDDSPTLDFGNLVGTGTTNPQYGQWTGAAGADRPGNLDITLQQLLIVDDDGTSTPGSSFTFQELSGSPSAAGDYLFEGSLTGDLDGNAGTPDVTVDFTLTAYADGRYALDLEQGFASTITFSSADGQLDAGGPDPVRTLTVGDEQIVFFGVQATSSSAQIVGAIELGEPDLTETELEGGGFSFIVSENMNVSTSGIGIANNNLEGNGTAGIDAGDESFVINPETLLSGMKVYIDNSVAGYDTATEALYYTVYYENGTTSGPTPVLSADLTAESGGQVSFGIARQGSELIDAVQLTMGTGTIKIPVIEFIQEIRTLASDVKLDFAASLTDADGDTATSNFSVDLYASELDAGGVDYSLIGASGDWDAFNVDLSAPENIYEVLGFDAPNDRLMLIGDSSATASIDNSGVDSIVTIGDFTVTVVGADLAPSNILIL